jgi:hypothetical protein
MSSLKVTNLKARSNTITVPGSNRLDLSEADGLKLPTWTDDTRPSSPSTGTIGYNLDSQAIDFYDGSAWGVGGGSQETLWYDEGNDVRSYTSNWNYTGTYNMSTLAGFGNSHVHEWGGSGRTYELTLSSIPAHAEVRYRCYIHMVDSWDNEYNEIRMTTGATGSSERTYLNWRKVWNDDFIKNVSASYGGMIRFYGNQPYSYEPWNGNNQRTNGYVEVDTNWQPHDQSSIRIFHRTDLNQAASDEAYYISHSKLYLR